MSANRLLSLVTVATALLPLTACGLSAPTDVECTSTTPVGTGGSLVDALAKAVAGTCVVIDNGVFDGALRVPDGVTLVAAEGATPELTGTGTVVELGAGSALHGVEVNATSAEYGVRAAGGSAVANVKVRGAGRANIAVTCDGAACDKTTSLRGIEVESGNAGVVIRGATVTFDNVGVQGISAARIEGGQGVVAYGGARVRANDVRVSNNEIGLLVDGADTRFTLSKGAVSDSNGRGLWVQGVRGGTPDDPAVRVADSEFVGNTVVGAGGSDVVGELIFVEDRIEETRIATLQDGKRVGDGLGFFAGSNGARVESSTLADNERAQVVCDNVVGELIFVENRIEQRGGAYGVVVQNTPDGVVQVPADALSDAPELDIPGSLQNADVLGE